MEPSTPFELGAGLGTDYFRIRHQLTPTQLDTLERTRAFVDQEVLPVINGYWERAEFPWPLVEKLAGLGVVGDGIVGYGCPDLDPMSVEELAAYIESLKAEIRRVEENMAKKKAHLTAAAGLFKTS